MRCRDSGGGWEAWHGNDDEAARAHGGRTPVKPFHALLVLPVIALLGTPFFPFVNSTTPWFGLPSVVVWVCAWCVLTSLILAFVLRRDERSGRLAPDAEDGA